MQVKQMAKEIRIQTIQVALFFCAIVFFFFSSNIKYWISGICIGCCMSLLGFQMIITMCDSINHDCTHIQKYAFQAYLRRYLIYAVIITISVMSKVSVFAILIGVLSHKISLFLYGYRHRKEDA